MTGRKGFINRFEKNQPKKTRAKLTKENSFLVFPFNIVMGYITSTETGKQNNDNIEITDFSNFQRIFTGLENLLAQWESAYQVNKVNDDDQFLTKSFNVGRSIRGFIDQETSNVAFNPASVSSDFIAEYVEDDFTMITYENMPEIDLYKLYIIPQLKEEKWLYIETARKFFNADKTFSHLELTFKTLGSKVAKTGQAVEEFVQRSAPGEGYAWPIVKDDEIVEVDDIRSRDIPTTSIQIEMSGAGAFNTIVAFGRPTIQKKVNGITTSTFNPKIETPRLLLPLALETPIPNPVNTRPSAEADMYIGDFKPSQQDVYKDWKEQFQGSFDMSMRNQFEGVLTAEGTLADLRTSNPVDSFGTHTHELWDPLFKQTLDEIYNTNTNALTDKTLTLNGEMTLPDIMAHQYFATSHLSTLPMTVQNNIGWSLKDIPVIGGFLSKLTLGIPIGWRNTAIRLKMSSVKLILPASLAEYGNVLKGSGTQDDKVWIPLETFTTERKDDATEYSGINSTGTIFKVQLTHRFKKIIEGAEYVFDTKDLGQDHPTVDDDGKAIPNPPTDKLLWDGTCVPTNRGNTPGYVIDMPHFKALAKLDYRITFFSNDFQIWSGTYQTNARFTGSIREWANVIKMSNWKETNNKVVSYPKAIVDPEPPKSNFPTRILFSDEVANNQPYNIAFAPAYVDWFASLGYSFKKYYTADGRWNANTMGLHLIQNGTKDLKVIRYDTTPLGGMTSVKNNYNKLTLNISSGSLDKQIIEIDTDELITSGSKEITLQELTRFTAGKDDSASPRERDAMADNGYPYSVYWNNTLKETPKITISVNGNEFIFTLSVNFNANGNGYINEKDNVAIEDRPQWETKPTVIINEAKISVE